ncbi:hypothetical protein SUDANB126_07381 [Streptomyces sp. enrichment culture]
MFPAALLHRLLLSRVWRGAGLVVRPGTVPCRHGDPVARRHAACSRPERPGRPRAVCSIRLPVLRFAGEDSSRGSAASTVNSSSWASRWPPPRSGRSFGKAGTGPVPGRATSRWADFPRSRADVLPACGFLETITLSGVRLRAGAVIEHAGRRIRVLGAAHPTASWVTQVAKGLVMDLEDAGCRAGFLIRDRDVSRPVRHRPHRGRDRGSTRRSTDAAHELDPGTAGAPLPARAAGPHPDRDQRPSSAATGMAVGSSCLSAPGAEPKRGGGHTAGLPAPGPTAQARRRAGGTVPA